MQYAIPYILLLLFFGTCAIMHEQSEEDNVKKQIEYASIGIFFFFFAFRGYIGTDFTVYYPYYENASFYDFYYKSEYFSFEPSFKLLAVICRMISSEFAFFVFVTTAINTTLMVRFFKKRVRNLPMILMLFTAFSGVGIFTNLMRNSFAIFIFLNSLEFLENRKPIQYFSLCLLAFSFHMSSIAYFPLYFFFHRKINKWIYIAVFSIANIVFLCKISLVSLFLGFLGLDSTIIEKLSTYLEMDASKALSLGYIERLITATLVFLYYDKLTSLRKTPIFVNAILFYLTIYILLGQFRELGSRAALLFIFGYWVIWIDMIKVFSIENNRLLFKLFIGTYCIIRIISAESSILQQYDNVLFGAKSYEERRYIFDKEFEEAE